MKAAGNAGQDGRSDAGRWVQDSLVGKGEKILTLWGWLCFPCPVLGQSIKAELQG